MPHAENHTRMQRYNFFGAIHAFNRRTKKSEAFHQVSLSDM